VRRISAILREIEPAQASRAGVRHRPQQAKADVNSSAGGRQRRLHHLFLQGTFTPKRSPMPGVLKAAPLRGTAPGAPRAVPALAVALI
jgi:hypothetical protein